MIPCMVCGDLFEPGDVNQRICGPTCKRNRKIEVARRWYASPSNRQHHISRTVRNTRLRNQSAKLAALIRERFEQLRSLGCDLRANRSTGGQYPAIEALHEGQIVFRATLTADGWRDEYLDSEHWHWKGRV